MNFEQIKFFLSIVKTGSFSMAADDMFISQSSISKQIKALEQELGAPLFHRMHSKVYLTAFGTRFAEFSHKIMQEYSELQLYKDEYVKQSQKTLCIGSIPIVASYGLLKHITDFTTTITPEINIVIDMHETNQREVLEKLYAGKIDMALIRTDYLKPLEPIEQLHYCKNNFAVICSNKHPLASRKTVFLRDLVKYSLAMLDQSSQLNTIVKTAFEKNKLPFNPVFLSTRHWILLDIVQKKDTYTILPTKLLETRTYPNLATIGINDSLSSEVALVRLKGRKICSIARNFWNYWQTLNLGDYLQNGQT